MSFHRLARWVLLSGLSLLAATTHAGVPPHDMPGSRDSPLVSRFADSTIIGYRTVDFARVVLPMGKYDDQAGKFTKTKTIAGKVTDIAYAAPAGKSAFEVIHNYQLALKKAGFATQYQCADDACGDSDYELSNTFVSSQLRQAMTSSANGDYGNSMIRLLECIGGKLHLLSARLARPQGNVGLSLLVCGNPGKRVGVALKIAEEKPMTTGQVTVNAEAMGKGLARHGHIALYGIRFATDSAQLTPASDATLAQMTKLLKAHPKLEVYIVGHTDNTGSLAHNLTLSRQRADAVVKALAARGIAASRMSAKGVASYAPVASNDTEAGRARNRRVELVKQ